MINNSKISLMVPCGLNRGALTAIASGYLFIDESITHKKVFNHPLELFTNIIEHHAKERNTDLQRRMPNKKGGHRHNTFNFLVKEEIE